MKVMIVSIYSFAFVLLSALPCQAVKITAFTDMDTFIKGAKDIVIAKCLGAVADAQQYDDGLYPVDVEVISVLKGSLDGAVKGTKKEHGKAKIATIYTMEVGKIYLLSSMGGSAFGTAFLAIPEMSVVELPPHFRLEDLKDKTVKEQVQKVFAARRQENERQQRRLEGEKKLLDKALALPIREEDDATPLTVVLRASKETPYKLIVEVVQALAKVKVAKIELEVSKDQTPGVSAVVRAGGATPQKAVVATMEALRAAGVDKLSLCPKR